ncbi:DUF3102 domain-containing protein [Dehalobacter sp. DCM]|uniref:DUF3102 domain-containing protein n=1 Tax=Dehalobacter sp. DCM TaxID=2907827 RepID=UPI003FCC46E9
MWVTTRSPAAYASNYQPVGNLTYTQSLLLLGLPAEESFYFYWGNHRDKTITAQSQGQTTIGTDNQRTITRPAVPLIA